MSTTVSQEAGRALDALIAEKVFGLSQRRIVPEWLGREVWLFSHPAYPDEVRYSWDEPSGNAVMYRDGKTAASGTAPNLPPYSDDIAAAWEIVERLSFPTDRCYFGLSVDADGLWVAELGSGCKSPRVKSAAHAICLVALEYVGLTKESEQP